MVRRLIGLISNFKKVVAEFKPDIIHAHLFWPSFLSQILYAHCKIKLVSTFHSTVYPGGWMHYARKFSTWYAKPVCIACSEAARKACVDNSLCPDKQLITVSNGVDTDFFSKALAEEPKDNPFQAGAGACKIIQVGNLEPYKGHLFTFEAVKALKNKGIRLYVCFAGHGSDLEKLTAAAEQLGVSDMVKFLGNRTDVISLLKASDIYIMPSLYEGLSIALLEAMAMELPVVASAVGGAPEVIQDGINGFLIPSADAAALAEKIELLVNNPQLRVEMGLAARKRVEQSYSLARQAKRLEELYKSLIKERL
jgi:glycosyltransferase involved in cell wall biosynthesis